MDEPTGAMIWYGGSSLLLALLLFFPPRRLIWIWRMRGLERQFLAYKMELSILPHKEVEALVEDIGDREIARA